MALIQSLDAVESAGGAHSLLKPHSRRRPEFDVSTGNFLCERSPAQDENPVRRRDSLRLPTRARPGAAGFLPAAPLTFLRNHLGFALQSFGDAIERATLAQATLLLRGAPSESRRCVPPRIAGTRLCTPIFEQLHHVLVIELGRMRLLEVIFDIAESEADAVPLSPVAEHQGRSGFRLIRTMRALPLANCGERYHRSFSLCVAEYGGRGRWACDHPGARAQ
jgi:hypothetical protein